MTNDIDMSVLPEGVQECYEIALPEPDIGYPGIPSIQHLCRALAVAMVAVQNARGCALALSVDATGPVANQLRKLKVEMTNALKRIEEMGDE